jgi:hypothetical protein
VFRAIHDDDGPTAADFECLDHPGLAYVLVRDHDDDIVGVAIVSMMSRVCYETHNALLPHVGWKKRVEIGKAFFQWLWDAGRCMRVIGKVVASNRYALKYNEAIGMKVFGVNERSFFKDGALRDEIWFGISRPEAA